ncbi:MAG TPA: DUF4272 domain-containing protein [Pirellulales bacterium]|nr:DUF4272 domain-containing protein [Pirellulales bacterium]
MAAVARPDFGSTPGGADMPSMPEYPNPDTWEYANPRQARRAAHSFDILRKRAVPVYWGPLFVADDDDVMAQSAKDVVQRALLLWLVTLQADGIPQADVVDWIKQDGLWDAASRAEKEFLENESPSADECRSLVWRLESVWVLLWALGRVDELHWPNAQCDVSKLGELLDELEADAGFMIAPMLRPISEILDAQDLILRIHWAIRDAYLHRQQMIPEDLDWSVGSELIPVTHCEGAAVVAQWHHTLNWLLDAVDCQDWDNVDTST